MSLNTQKYLSSHKIIFLDFDGVLNNLTEMRAQSQSSHPTMFKQMFSYQNMKCLRKLIEITGAKVVLTTSHRYRDLTLAIFKEICKLNYIDGCVIDRTKDLYHENRQLSSAKIRVIEINEWLDRHPSCVKYIVLDDMNMELHNFIQTDLSSGLTMENVEKAIELL